MSKRWRFGDEILATEHRRVHRRTDNLTLLPNHDQAPVPDVRAFRADARTASPAQVMTLQRLAGNQAVSSVLAQRSVVVQRDEETELALTQISGGLDTANTQFGQWGGVGIFGRDTQGRINFDTGSTTLDSAKMGQASVGIGVATNLTGTVLSSISAERARQRRNAAVSGEAEHRAGTREFKGSTTNAVQSAYGLGSNVTSLVAGTSGLQSMEGVTSTFANAWAPLGAASGVVALPLSAFSVGRTIRKAHKQRLRWEALTQLKKSQETAPREALKAAEAEVEVLQAELQAHREDLADAQTRLANVKSAPDEAGKARRLQMIAIQVQDAEDQIVNAEQRLQAAEDEARRREAAKNAMEQAVRDAAARAKNPPANPTLEDIQAFAIQKNQSGLIKKIVGAVGGLLSVGGGIASTVASFAAIGATGLLGTAALGTPIGWALAGAAAVIGLGLASYATWRFFSKRWARSKIDESTGQPRSTAARIGVTLKFWKKVGKSQRENYAEKLYDMAFTGTDPRQADARNTIEALGLNWRKLNMGSPGQKAASIELIMAKMAS